VDLDPGVHDVSVGGFHSIRLTIASDGSIAVAPEDAHKASVAGSTVTFITTPILVNTNLYEEQWAVHRGAAWHIGDRTVDLVPGRYSLSPGGYDSLFFDVAADGAVTVDAEDAEMATSVGDALDLITVAVTVDPGAYAEQWSLHRGATWLIGPQTRQLVPGRWSLSPGGFHAMIFYVAADGAVTIDPGSSHKATATGDRLDFVTFPVDVEPDAFVDRWGLHRGAAWRVGPATFDLTPGRYQIAGGDHATFQFDVLADGAVEVHPQYLAMAEASDNDLTFLTQQITVDPGDYTGGWQKSYGAFVRYGVQDMHVLAGGLYLSSVGYGGEVIQIGSPCSVSPDAFTDDNGVTFDVTCSDDLDSDEDGVLDADDNCVDTPNPLQVDLDDDGLGDLCDDDRDGDAVLDDDDNCPDFANTDQANADADGVGDVCDDDDDGDLVPDTEDNCLGLANPDQAESDGDGLGDACDPDDDDDGVLDGDDNCPLVYNDDQLDFDQSGQGDVCDDDDDWDGVEDALDLCPATPADLPITADGCSGEQWKTLECPADGFSNHGQYVRCVVDIANQLREDGVLTQKEAARMKGVAAKSR
jgi:hypothetical protein